MRTSLRAGKRFPARTLSLALLAAGCAPQVSGVVRDGGSERPIPGASVELSTSGWGKRDGQIVWDAEHVSQTLTDGQGQFSFGGDGGTGLRVRAAGHAALETSLCPRSPTLVRVGGPYPELRADQRLLFTAGRGAYGLFASGSALDGGGVLRIMSYGGVQFVVGTGTIPPAPPLPYERSIDFDLRTACGWLFVANGSRPVAVIQIGSHGWEQDPGGPKRFVLLHTPLPR